MSSSSATDAADGDGDGDDDSGDDGGGTGNKSGWSARIARLCQNFGIYVAVLVVMLAVVAATGVAIARLTQDQSNAAVRQQQDKQQTAFEELAAERLEESSEGNNDNVTFLVGYALELVFALFVFYFFTSTVFFSGILGCGRIPFLGGRPYEVRQARSNDKNDGDENGDDDDEYIEEEGREMEYVDEESRGNEQGELVEC